MFIFWESLSYTTKFSTIATVVTLALGLVSMGFLGIGLYYTVGFLFSSYPPIKKWHGDWVWPVLIGSGMAWSFGFVIAGVAWHYLSPIISSIAMLRLIYVGILWAWAAFVWYMILRANRYRLK